MYHTAIGGEGGDNMYHTAIGERVMITCIILL